VRLVAKSAASHEVPAISDFGFPQTAFDEVERFYSYYIYSALSFEMTDPMEGSTGGSYDSSHNWASSSSSSGAASAMSPPQILRALGIYDGGARSDEFHTFLDDFENMVSPDDDLLSFERLKANALSLSLPKTLVEAACLVFDFKPRYGHRSRVLYSRHNMRDTCVMRMV
jgi:hypothetical protein